jgi:hypothetical protein
MSEGTTIRLVAAGAVFASVFLPVMAVAHLVAPTEISLLSPADGDGPPAFFNQSTQTLLPGRDGHLLFKSTRKEPIPPSFWSQREKRGQHPPVALLESELTTTERFRQQANRPAKGAGGKS